MREQRNLIKSKFPEFHELCERLNDLSICGNSSGEAINHQTLPRGQELAKSSTTILAIRCLDCVILAGDRRTSAGLEIFSDNTQKIQQLSKFSAAGFSGTCVSIQDTKELVIQICNSFGALYDYDLSLDGQAKILQTMVRYYYFLSMQMRAEEYVTAVLVGYDTGLQKPRIFQHNIDGYVVEVEKFTGVGCGFLDVKQLLEDKWRKNMKIEVGLELIIEALGYSGKASSGVSDIRISPPTVAIINKSGLQWVTESKVKQIVKTLIKNKKGGLA